MRKCSNLSVEEVIDDGISPVLAMSTQHFAFLYQELGYTDVYSPELKKVSHQFLLKALPNIGLAIPSLASIESAMDEQSLLQAWENYLSKLEFLGLRDNVCNYLLKLKLDNNYFRKTLFSKWINVLFDSFNSKQNGSLLTIDISKENKLELLIRNKITNDLNYSLHTISELKNIVQHDTWENYVIYERSNEKWLSNTKKMYQSIQFWVEFLRLLSETEIGTINEWGLQKMKEKYSKVPDHYYFSLTQLSRDLKLRGYLDKEI